MIFDREKSAFITFREGCCRCHSGSEKNQACTPNPRAYSYKKRDLRLVTAYVMVWFHVFLLQPGGFLVNPSP